MSSVLLVSDAQGASSEIDPLDYVSAYSLQIGPDGPAAGYFPIGMRPGQPHQTTHTGFNLWQNQIDNYDFTRGVSVKIPDENAEHDAHGLFYFTQARANNSLIRKKPNPDGPVGNYGTFPSLITDTGKPAERGSKNSANLFYEGTRRFLLDYMKDIGGAAGAIQLARPTLFWGMDNEWEGVLDYSIEARRAYASWLETRFETSAELNRTWGTSLPSFADVVAVMPPTPDEFDRRPAEFLAWHTFQSEHFTDLLATMAETLHASDPLHRPVVYKSTQQTIEMPFTHRRKLYDNVLFGERMRPIGGGLQGANIYGAGDRQAYEINYIYNIIRPLDGAPGYGVMCPEINNHSGPGYQWAATYWRVLANGLKAANFFTTGYEGAKGDYASFGHFGPDGKPRDKMFYAARWAHMVHRTEQFWKDAVPGPDMPRVAMLVPRRDIVLAERTDRRVSRWAYPVNHRVMVYAWLREQGYWVDVIPETKLDAAYLLKNNQALFLIGAEHLSQAEAGAIKDYVEAGGVVVTDERPGHFDELHREKRWLETLSGVHVRGYDAKANYYIKGGPLDGVRASGKLDVELANDVTVLMRTEDNRPLVTTRTVAKGRVVHLGFITGDLRNDPNRPVEVSTFKVNGENETADTGDSNSVEQGAEIGRWLASLLDSVGVRPAYVIKDLKAVESAALRVEQPMVDSRGNMVVVVAMRGVANPSEKVPACALDIVLPGGSWTRAVWGSAEDTGLRFVEVSLLKNGLHRVNLPAVETAGVLYFFKDHAPLLGIPQINTPDRAVDGHAAKVRPGTPFTVEVQLLNPAETPVAAGEIRLAAVQGWTVEPKIVATPVLAPGEARTLSFRVTPPAADALKRNWLYPLVGRWALEGEDRAINAANVEVKFD